MSIPPRTSPSGQIRIPRHTTMQFLNMTAGETVNQIHLNINSILHSKKTVLSHCHRMTLLICNQSTGWLKPTIGQFIVPGIDSCKTSLILTKRQMIVPGINSSVSRFIACYVPPTFVLHPGFLEHRGKNMEGTNSDMLLAVGSVT